MSHVAIFLFMIQAPTPLVVEPLRRDFGEAKAGAVLHASCELKNTSSEAIEIGEVATACGCQKPTLDKKILQPGETAKLSLSIATLSQPAGPREWKATIHYRQGGENRIAEAVFAAKITREIDVEPVQIAGTFDRNFESVITLHDRRPKPVAVLKVSTGSRLVEAAIGPMNADGRQSIRLTAQSDLAPGDYSDAVHLETGDADYPELNIPIRLTKNAPGGVSVHPERLTLRWSAGQSTVTGLFVLRAKAEGQSFSIEKVECEEKAARTKFATAAGVGTVRITLDTQDLKPGATELAVRIKDPQPRVLKIPVNWEGP